MNLSCGSLVVEDIFLVKVSMDKLLRPHAPPQPHTRPGCAHTPLCCESEGGTALSPISKFAACYEARESVDVLLRWPGSVSSEAPGQQRKQWPMGCSSFMEKGV